ncbi:MAG: hypothetical protein RLZZ330_1201 [Actinomycetota bacterium]|jgi:pantoate--beta-alanine ligase
MTKVFTSVKELQTLLASKKDSKKVGTVFTMGALHDGHASLMQECRKEIGNDGILVVTVFVNPTQFNDPKDLEKYPRTLDADVALCTQNGVDVLFAPTADEIYPDDLKIEQITPGPIAGILEGASRPGHFAGVATVVYRLIEITKPDVTCFGQKDYQQLVVVGQLIKSQKLNVKLVGVSTVREKSGLAMSSRNQRLSIEQRVIATKLFEAMNMVKTELLNGHSISDAKTVAISYLDENPEIELDYLEVLSAELSKPEPGLARILIAARIGDVRLIDNLECEIGVENV